MSSAGMGVEHGAHMFWEPKTTFEVAIYQKIIQSHQPGGEPLLRFVPGMRRPILSVAQTASPTAEGRIGLGPYAGDPRRLSAATVGSAVVGIIGYDHGGTAPAAAADPGDAEVAPNTSVALPSGDWSIFSERQSDGLVSATSDPKPVWEDDIATAGIDMVISSVLGTDPAGSALSRNFDPEMSFTHSDPGKGEFAHVYAADAAPSRFGANDITFYEKTPWSTEIPLYVAVAHGRAMSLTVWRPDFQDSAGAVPPHRKGRASRTVPAQARMAAVPRSSSLSARQQPPSANT